MAQSLVINIDSPIAGEEVGQAVPVSGTLSVVGTGVPLVMRVVRVEVQFGVNGPVVEATVAGPPNQARFPRTFSCSGPLPPGAQGGQDVAITVTAHGLMRG
jgi:hypothetical protein